MILLILLLNVKCELSVLHSSLYAKVPSCGSAGCNLDGWTQLASPNYLVCAMEGMAINVLDSNNKYMYRQLSYPYPKAYFVLWMDVYYMGTWTNEAWNIKYNNVLFQTFTYTSPTTYPYSSQFCDTKQYDVASKKIIISGQSYGYLAITNVSTNGKLVIRNLIFAVEKCHWSCKTCTIPNTCTSCFTGTSLVGGLCTQCSGYLDPILGCVEICDINKYPDSNNYCVDITEQAIINDSFKNTPPYGQWVRLYDITGLTTSLKCTYFFGLLTGGEGMEKKIQPAAQYKHKLRIKILLYLYNTFPLNYGILILINHNYIGQFYNLNGVLTVDNGYILKSQAQNCPGVGNGLLYQLILNYPIPTGDFTLTFLGNMKIDTVIWGVQQVQLVAGYCQQQCIECISDYQCIQCIPSYYIYNGLCTNIIPKDYLSLNSTHQITYDLELPNSYYLANDLNSYNIKQDPDNYFDLISQNSINFYPGFHSFGLYSKKIFGGPFVWSNAVFSKTYTISDPHHAISVRMNIILSNLFSSQFCIEFETNGQQFITPGPTSADLFGESATEYSIKKYWFISHNTNTFTITVECQGDGNLLDQYCGISDYYIVVHKCYPFCLDCSDQTESSCITWGTIGSVDISSAKFSQADCLVSEYFEPADYLCYSCNSLCLTCDTLVKCDSCINNLILFNDFCTCSNGYYYDSTDQMCYQCDPLCWHCQSYSQCILCKAVNKRITINGVCVCQQGFYNQPGNDVCLICENSCLTCDGPLNSNCTSCSGSSFQVLQSNGKCQCQSSYYYGVGVCQKCHITCKECFGPNNDNCLDCVLTRQLIGLSCKCKLNYFDSGISSECESCPIIENSQLTDCYINCNSVLIWFNQICSYTPTCLSGYQVLNYQCSPICGDGVIIGSEECEDNNVIQDDGCFNCKFQCPLSCPACNSGVCSPICGDGYVTGSEQCDDAIATIGCSSCSYQCQTQCSDCQNGKCYSCNVSGYVVDVKSNKCIEHCGDGIILGTEQCEDSNQNGEDGCDNCRFRCRSDCLVCSSNGKACLTCLTTGYKAVVNTYKCVPICGDGLKVANPYETEQCDDGNLIASDGCSSSCTWQCQPVAICTTCNSNICSGCALGYTLVSIKNKCVPICGDGLVLSSEICDDANTSYYDGCNQCQLMCQSSCLTCSAAGCTHCQLGYKLNKFNNLCDSLCGNGIITAEEECDDSNANCIQCRYLCYPGCLNCVFGVCYRCSSDFIMDDQIMQCKLIERIKTTSLTAYSKTNHSSFSFIAFCSMQILNVCLECESDYYWNQWSQQCLLNYEKCIQNCQYCYQSQCVLCQSHFRLINNICVYQETLSVATFSDQFSCKLYLNDLCLLCMRGYQLILGNCIPVCGDGITADGEECDDNNSLFDDGCYDCKFNCFGNCLSCQFGICYECDTPQLLVYSKMQCYDSEICDQGYYINQYDNTCVSKCGDLIKTEDEECDSNFLCQDCRHVCSPGCNFCSTDNLCFSCYNEYTLNETTYLCQPIYPSKTISVAAIIKQNNIFCVEEEYCFYNQQPVMKLIFEKQFDNSQLLTLSFDQNMELVCPDILLNRLFQVTLLSSNQQILTQLQYQDQQYLINVTYTQSAYNPIILVELLVNTCLKNQFNQTLLFNNVTTHSSSIVIQTESEKIAMDIISNIANAIQYVIIFIMPTLIFMGNIENCFNFIDLLQYLQYQTYMKIAIPPNLEGFYTIFQSTSVNRILSSISLYPFHYIDTPFNRNASFISTAIPIGQVYVTILLIHQLIIQLQQIVGKSALQLRTQNKFILKLHIKATSILNHLNKNNFKNKMENFTIGCGLEICMNSLLSLQYGYSDNNRGDLISYCLSGLSLASFSYFILNRIKMPILIILRSKDKNLNPIPKDPEKYKVQSLIFCQNIKKLAYSCVVIFSLHNDISKIVSLIVIDIGYGFYIYDQQPFQHVLENKKILLQQINNVLINCCNLINSLKITEQMQVIGFIQVTIITFSLTTSLVSEIKQKKNIIFQVIKNWFHVPHAVSENPGIVEFIVYE